MYLQDFERIGGIFKPGKTLHSSSGKVLMRGELFLKGEIFHIKIIVRKNQYVKIAQICGQTKDEAVSSKKRLLQIYHDALRCNQFQLKTLVRNRYLKTLLWSGILLSDIACVIMSIFNIYLYGINIALLLALIASLALLVICKKCKMAMIRIN